MREKILAALRAKYKDMGFSEKDFEGVLSLIEGSITADDQIDGAVNGLEGTIKAVQQIANRWVNTAVAKPKPPAPDPTPQPTPDPANDPVKVPDDTPPWVKTLIDQNKALGERLTVIESGKTIDSRKSQLEKTLEGVSDAFKNTTLKAFARMNFKDDDEFSSYLEEVKTDSAEFVQSETNTVLGHSKPPVKAGGGNANKQATKEELDKVMKSIPV